MKSMDLIIISPLVKKIHEIEFHLSEFSAKACQQLHHFSIGSVNHISVQFECTPSTLVVSVLVSWYSMDYHI